MNEEPTASTKENALVRWENEGGRTDSGLEQRDGLIQEESRILQCLGGAVIARWNCPRKSSGNFLRALFRSVTHDPWPN